MEESDARCQMPDARDQGSETGMADVSEKEATERTAVARGKIKISSETARAIKKGALAKGDVLGAAQLSGIMAAKKTPELIPLCHPLHLEFVGVECKLDENVSAIEITSTVKAFEKTGVEMEALTATTVAALVVYDMCKPIDKEITIGEIRLVEKRGGRSGTYVKQ